MECNMDNIKGSAHEFQVGVEFFTPSTRFIILILELLANCGPINCSVAPSAFVKSNFLKKKYVNKPRLGQIKL